VVNSVQLGAVHEMLCRLHADQFDNRMYHEKNQLRENASGLVRGFPLLYSKFIREEIYGQTNADSPTADLKTCDKVIGSNNHRKQQFLNP
jgi:hypothetical protein